MPYPNDDTSFIQNELNTKGVFAGKKGEKYLIRRQIVVPAKCILTGPFELIMSSRFGAFDNLNLANYDGPRACGLRIAGNDVELSGFTIRREGPDTACRAIFGRGFSRVHVDGVTVKGFGILRG